jgi:amino-acid N-acetyltransferase
LTKRKSRGQTPKLRTAVRGDAKRIHELIQQHAATGHLLPRELSEVMVHVDRFVVAVDGRGSVVACGELAPLSHALAEIRSLVVGEKRRGTGVGRSVVDELRRRARVDGYDDICVFAHQPAYFAHMGFSIVPHTWVPEKISVNCRTCALFRHCGQYAMVEHLEPLREHRVAEQPLHV